MSGTRRRFFQDAAIFGAGLFGLSTSARSATPDGAGQTPRDNETGRHHSPYGEHTKRTAPAVTRDPFVPMVTPDVADVPYEMDGVVKVFRLTAEPVKRKIAPFKTIDAWG